MTATVGLGYAPASGRHDAILEFTQHLAAALALRGGLVATVLLRRRRGAWTAGAAVDIELPLHRALRSAGTTELALQYNPFSYGHWGVAPGLVAELVEARRRGALRRLVLVVHEPFIVESGFRYTLIGAVQRQQLGLVLRLADDVLATCEGWLAPLAKLSPRTRVDVLPAGSNMPDRRCDRLDVRAELGASPRSVVVATFGLNHPHQRVGHVRAALAAMLESGREIIYIGLGESSDDVLIKHPCLQVLTPGRQEADALAKLLAASDLFLAPYPDGASTRRTTLMAALQHGLCVVTTYDEDRRAVGEEALTLASVSDIAGFAELSQALAVDPADRHRLGVAARELYERRYSWDALAARYLEVVCPSDRT